MNDIILPRALEPRVERLLRQFPVVVVTGARQTGKTTLVRRLPASRGRVYRTLDDPDSLEAAVRDPEAFLAEAPRLTIDEVQRRPDLLTAVKRLVDRGRVPGRFLLTGSANLLLMARVSESLAGRAAYVTLRPMTESEKAGRPQAGPWSDLLRSRSAREALDALPRTAPRGGSWTRAALEGGFPSPAREADPVARREWLAAYVATYVERDLRQLAQIDSLIDFRRLMRVAALRVGCLANQADMARDAGLSHATAHRYLNLLETSFLIARVSPYAVNRTKRLAKAPKLYWEDTALAAHLAGIEDEEGLRAEGAGGALLENLVWHHLRCWADAEGPRAQVATWRTAGGEEVDFVLESGPRVLPVEVKAASRAGGGDLRHLESFLAEYKDRARLGVVLYGGTEPRILSDRILAVPIGSALDAP